MTRQNYIKKPFLRIKFTFIFNESLKNLHNPIFIHKNNVGKSKKKFAFSLSTHYFCIEYFYEEDE